MEPKTNCPHLRRARIPTCNLCGRRRRPRLAASPATYPLSRAWGFCMTCRYADVTRRGGDGLPMILAFSTQDYITSVEAIAEEQKRELTRVREEKTQIEKVLRRRQHVAHAFVCSPPTNRLAGCIQSRSPWGEAGRGGFRHGLHRRHATQAQSRVRREQGPWDEAPLKPRT